jgi:catalase
LAAAVADGLGMPLPAPLPPATDRPPYEYPPSAALSLFARPGATGIRTRRVALLVAPGVDGTQVRALYASLLDDGAVPRLVSERIGPLVAGSGASLDVEISLETGPSVLWDGVIVPDSASAQTEWHCNVVAQEFVKLQYRHNKPLLALGSGGELLRAAKIPRKLPRGGIADPGVIAVESADAVEALARFKTVLAQHRVYARETDPPRV